jgi:hypothetical protein
MDLSSQGHVQSLPPVTKSYIQDVVGLIPRTCNATAILRWKIKLHNVTEEQNSFLLIMLSRALSTISQNTEARFRCQTTSVIEKRPPAQLIAAYETFCKRQQWRSRSNEGKRALWLLIRFIRDRKIHALSSRASCHVWVTKGRILGTSNQHLNPVVGRVQVRKELRHQYRGLNLESWNHHDVNPHVTTTMCLNEADKDCRDRSWQQELKQSIVVENLVETLKPL